MATLTIKNIPSEVYEALSEMAKRNRRSINGEAIFRLEHSLQETGADQKTVLDRIRTRREHLREKGVWLTDDLIDLAKNEGRP